MTLEQFSHSFKAVYYAICPMPRNAYYYSYLSCNVKTEVHTNLPTKFSSNDFYFVIGRDKGMRRRGQPMTRKRPSRYDDDYEEERPRTRKGNRREESYPRNRNRGYRKGDRKAI
jgi:hypothetical protein